MNETPEPQTLVVSSEETVQSMVEQPAKVMRIGTMIKQLLDEARQAPLDEAGRKYLAAVHQKSVAELQDGLSPDLVEELQRLSLPFDGEEGPSQAQLRIAQAQLVGWLEGVFHGIQAAVFAQQALASGRQPSAKPAELEAGSTSSSPQPGTGQYL